MDSKTLTDLISHKLDISTESVNQMMEGLIKIIGERCAELDSIAIPAFGTFEPKKRLERIALHPASGNRLLVPPKISLTFKPSYLLKQKIKDGR